MAQDHFEEYKSDETIQLLTILPKQCMSRDSNYRQFDRYMAKQNKNQYSKFTVLNMEKNQLQ